MKFGVQILTVRSIPVQEQDYFATQLLINGNSTPIFNGLDTYHINTIVLPGKKIAGTGRDCTYTHRDLICGMGNLEAKSFVYSDLPEEINTIVLEISTNLLLDYRQLPMQLELDLHWIDGGKEQSTVVSLQRPDIMIGWEERGTYQIGLTEILQRIALETV